MKRFVVSLLALSIVCAISLVVPASADRNALSSLSSPAPPGEGITIQTPQQPWTLWRTVTANSTALTPATNVWETVADREKGIPQSWNTMSYAVLAAGNGVTAGGDPNGGSFAIKLRLGRQYGSAEYACDSAWTVGDLVAGVDPATGQTWSDGYTYHKWAERPSITAQKWVTTVFAGGDVNDVGKLTLDRLEYWGSDEEISAMTGVGVLYIYVSGR